MSTKIGIKAVAGMPPNSVIWDDKIKGLCARRQRSDVVTFSVVFRTRDGIQRWHKVGRFGVFSPDQARREAARILREVALGEDPSAQRMALRNSLTVAQLCDEYMQRENGKKPATIKSDKSRINLHIKPKLGRLKVASITSDEIEAFMHSLTPGSAGRTIGLLGAIFTFAVKCKLRPDSPCHGFDKPSTNKRTRRLSDGEYAQLQKVIDGVTNPIVANVFTMIAIGGWRSSEIKNLRWAELDLQRQIATLGDTKTGLSIRPLSKAAINIIEAKPKKMLLFSAISMGALSII